MVLKEVFDFSKKLMTTLLYLFFLIVSIGIIFSMIWYIFAVNGTMKELINTENSIYSVPEYGKNVPQKPVVLKIN
jgi:hypothetical protein